MIDAETLATCTGATPSRAAAWTLPISSAMDQYQIDSPARQAAFLSQIGHESGGLNWTAELWGPTAQQLKYEPPSELAAELGNTDKGDGSLFRGRGLIMITGRANYTTVADALCLDCLNNPAMLAAPEWAAMSAAWWWSMHGLNALADAGNFQQITRVINGGLTGEADRERLWGDAKQALGVAP
jgi:putative chitinase